MKKNFIYDPTGNTLTLMVKNNKSVVVYEIDLGRIITEADLLRWVTHLLGKIWMTRSVMCDLIRRIAEIKKERKERPIEIYGL